MRKLLFVYEICRKSIF